MLRSLSIKNFAIIDNIDIEFFDKMTVLTGSTGAGKSLIIDSINLLLGARADLDMIRYGETKASIVGKFDVTEDIKKELDRLLISSDKLTIERILGKKNIIKVNDVSITLQELNKLGRMLADVHTQEDTYKLINPDTYLVLIDNFGNINKEKYIEALFEYNEELKKYNNIVNKSKTLNEKIDLLNFQYNELNQLNLKENELEDLLIQEDKLKNFDKIYKNLNQTYELLENEYFQTSNIYKAALNLKDISEFDEEYKKYYETLNNSYYDLEDTVLMLKKTIDSLDFDPIELDNITSRIVKIKEIEKKYNKTTNELIKYILDIKFEIDLQTNYDDVLISCKEEVLKKYEKLKNEALDLRQKRKESALKITKELIDECEDLDLQNVSFEIEFKDNLKNPFESSFDESGIDVIDFLISMNLGEPKKSLHKVASGGELSRIMLGLKDILAKNNHLSLMVFDEIDTGISGTTSLKIAKKIKKISEFTQVLSITHQAQVAAVANRQLFVEKEIIDGRTITSAKYLNTDERIKEIALMLSGTLSVASLNGAKELLEI